MVQATIQFHLDECLPNLVATGLRKRDRNCTTTKDAGLIAASDDEQLAHAHRQKRMLVTGDHDFLILADEGYEHSGIAFWTRKHTVYQLIKDLDQLCFDHTRDEVQNTVVYF